MKQDCAAIIMEIDRALLVGGVLRCSLPVAYRVSQTVGVVFDLCVEHREMPEGWYIARSQSMGKHWHVWFRDDSSKSDDILRRHAYYFVDRNSAWRFGEKRWGKGRFVVLSTRENCGVAAKEE